jgi:hypothetical protein
MEMRLVSLYMKRRIVRSLGIFGAGLFAIYLVIAGLQGAKSGPTASTFNAAPVLQKVQSLGELRTARFTYRDVFEYQTQREPQMWLSYMPGASSLVQASTRNTALMSVTAQVEAGLDLREAKVAEESNEKKIVLIVPQPRVYKPQVEAKVHNMKIGLLWSDHNLGLKAQQDAQIRLKQAAVQQGIVSKAKESAVEVLTNLVAPLTGAEVEIRFSE